MKDKDATEPAQDAPAVGGQVQQPVRPVPEANCGNMRRVIRAARLCEELGHPGDTLAALEELKRLRGAALGVVAHMEGRLPVRGWLRDNDKSRDALDELVRVLVA